MNINVYIKFCLWLAPVSRQEEANPLFWLAWPVDDIGLSCLLAITHFLLQEKILPWSYNKSFFNQACSGQYGSILAMLFLTLTPSQSIRWPFCFHCCSRHIETLWRFKAFGNFLFPFVSCRMKVWRHLGPSTKVLGRLCHCCCFSFFDKELVHQLRSTILVQLFSTWK